MFAPRIDSRSTCLALVLFACASSEPVWAAAQLTTQSVSAIPPVTLDQTDEEPTCVEVWPEVRYRNYGYDHIVHLYSRCEIDAYCKVSSDVNPNPTDVVVPKGEEVQVLTFRASPAREFTPRVECRFRV